MHAVIRNYSGKGAKELLALLQQRKAEVEQIFRSIKGFVSYAAAETDSGCFTMTICETKTSTDESVALARDWVAKNAASLGLGAPTITEGSVAIHMK